MGRESTEDLETKNVEPSKIRSETPAKILDGIRDFFVGR